MPANIKIIEFQSVYQKPAAELVNIGLGEHFGYVDEEMNPDLFNIEESYLDGVFLLSLDDEQIVGQANRFGVHFKADKEVIRTVLEGSGFALCRVFNQVVDRLV
jgi:hypothetical protein